jgi:hypothetical protein
VIVVALMDQPRVRAAVVGDPLIAGEPDPAGAADRVQGHELAGRAGGHLGPVVGDREQDRLQL